LLSGEEMGAGEEMEAGEERAENMAVIGFSAFIELWSVEWREWGWG